MIEVRGLTKSFGHQRALRGVDLDLAEGQFLTLFGPNGAGKTTFINVLSTLSKPTSGRVRVNGVDLRAEAADLRRHIGLVSHHTLLYDDLTPDENLRFYGRMYDVPHLPGRIDAVLEWVGLDHRRHDPVRTFSRGMQQRLSIARAILHDPAVMLLDEPYTGLDQHAAEMLRQVLQTIATEGRTVLMTTHNLERGLEMSDRVAILVKGRIVYHAGRDEVDVSRFRETYNRHVEGTA